MNPVQTADSYNDSHLSRTGVDMKFISGAKYSDTKQNPFEEITAHGSRKFVLVSEMGYSLTVNSSDARNFTFLLASYLVVV